MNARCRKCRRYVDGLTDSAVRHPIFDDLCVQCGNKEQRSGVGHTRADQQLREHLVYPEVRR